MLLDNYHGVLAHIAELETVIQKDSFVAESIDGQISEIKISEDQLSQELQNSKETILYSYKQDKIARETEQHHKELGELNSQLEWLEKAQPNVLKGITQQVEGKYFGYENQIKQFRALLSTDKSAFEGMISEHSLSGIQKSIYVRPLPLASLTRLATSVRSLEDKARSLQSKPKIDLLVEKLLMKDLIKKTDKPLLGLAVYLLYLLGIAAVVYYAQGVALLAYVALSLYTIADTDKRSQEVLEVYTPYEQLRVGTDILEATVSKQMAKEIEKNTQKSNSEYEAQHAKLTSEIADRKAKIEEIKHQILENMNEVEATSGIAAKYSEEMDFFKNQKAEVFKQKEEVANTTTSNKSMLKELYSQKENLHAEIVETYMTPASPGSSRLLQKSFFLGFNQDESLLEFPYNGESTIIFWSGENSSTNTNVVKMMIMQLLTSMDASCLDISLVDTRDGGSDFAIFQYKELEELFSICPTAQSFEVLVDSMHLELQKRNRQIMTIADNITEFNQRMIDSRSLTLEYKLIFIQNGGSAIYGNQKFLQICKNGPAVGIIPIIFLPQVEVRDAIFKDDKKRRKDIIDLMESVKEQLYKFTGERSSLFHYDDAYKQSTIERLRSDNNAVRD